MTHTRRLKMAFEFLTIPRMVFLIFFIALTTYLPLTDPDYFWHLITGEYIVNQRMLPRQDIFSFTMADHPWVLHEWLFQVILFLIFKPFGTIGIKIFTASIALLSIHVLYRITVRLSSGQITTVVMLILLPALISCGIAPRPQLFTYLFFSFFIYALLSFKYFNQHSYLYALPPIMVFWVNLHGGYIIGLALLFLFAATELLSRLLLDKKREKQLTVLSFPFVIAILSLLASSLNPDFFEHWKYPFQVMSMKVAMNVILEWKSPSFHDIVGKLYLLTVVVFFLVNIYRRNKPDITEIVLPLFFIIEGFIAIRHIPLAGIVMIPFIAHAVHNRPQTNPFIFFTNKYLLPVSRIFRSSLKKDLGNKEFSLNWVFLFSVLFAAFLAAPVQHANISKIINSKIPARATDFIIDNNIQGNMFNTYAYGGYLIYRLYPNQKVFIDGRADMYGDNFLEKYIEIHNGYPGWEKEFDQYAIDYVICRRTAPIRQLLLARADFNLVYDDKYNSVLVKNSPRFSRLTPIREATGNSRDSSNN